jgi:hypothetical protein
VVENQYCVIQFNKKKHASYVFCTHVLQDSLLHHYQENGYDFVFSVGYMNGPTQPPIQWVLGLLTPGVERPGREDDHSSPSSAKV